MCLFIMCQAVDFGYESVESAWAAPSAQLNRYCVVGKSSQIRGRFGVVSTECPQANPFITCSALPNIRGGNHERYNPVVVHNYCRCAEHFLAYLARPDIAADAAIPDHVSGYLRIRCAEVPRASRSPTSAAMGIDSSGGNPRAAAACAETMATRPASSARLGRFADRYATSTESGYMCSAVLRKRPSAR